MYRYFGTNKDDLIDDRGVSYRSFASKLKPRFLLLWIQLLTGHFSLFVIAYFLIRIRMTHPNYLAPAMLISIVLFGYDLAYILLFFHEAAHFNIAPNRKANDVCANVFIGSLFGQDIRQYRIIHWDHHRFHGLPNDSEHTYFDPLDMKFLFEALIGLRAFRVLADRKNRLQKKKGADKKRYRNSPVLIAGVALNLGVLLFSLLNNYWYLVVCWIIAMAGTFPFFVAVRQLLEHRDEFATKGTDYFKVAHGAINRLFGTGPLASTLGGAGFNRHLLHHFAPQIPSTRLKEFEEYLMNTAFADYIKPRQTTYIRTFRKLVQY